ncbi:DedA family protein [Patescibacteria group bacterium]|nr:DedA family protein [Patescibacteria group bacterium]
MNLISLIGTLEKLFSSYGYPLVFVSSFIEISPLGWTIPGGSILAIAGFFAYGGKISLLGIILAGWLGAWLTFMVAYFLGFKSGYKLVRVLRIEKTSQKAKTLLKNHGGVILTTSMLANLTRFAVAYVAGAQKYPFWKFIFYSGAASLTWTSLMVTVGFLAGSERQNLERGIIQIGIAGWIFLLIALGIMYWVNKKEKETIENQKNDYPRY